MYTNPDGSYSFAPAPDYTGAIPAITYTVSDQAGGSDTSTLQLSMVPVNDNPVDGDETGDVTEDTTLSVTAAGGLLANTTDVDGGTPVISGYSIAGLAGTQAVGTPVSITGVGTLTIHSDGGGPWGCSTLSSSDCTSASSSGRRLLLETR